MPVMQQPHQKLKTVHQARPWAVEHGVAVNQHHTALLDCFEVWPEATGKQGWQLLDGLLHMQTDARHHPSATVTLPQPWISPSGMLACCLAAGWVQMLEEELQHTALLGLAVRRFS